MILGNLSSILGRTRLHEEALKVVENSLSLAIRWEKGNYLVVLLYNKLWNEEERLESGINKKAIKKICELKKKLFFIARIMKYTSIVNRIEVCQESLD